MRGMRADTRQLSRHAPVLSEPHHLHHVDGTLEEELFINTPHPGRMAAANGPPPGVCVCAFGLCVAVHISVQNKRKR